MVSGNSLDAGQRLWQFPPKEEKYEENYAYKSCDAHVVPFGGIIAR